MGIRKLLVNLIQLKPPELWPELFESKIEDTDFFLWFSYSASIWEALRDLIPLVQFMKCEKYSWRTVTFKYASIVVFHVFEKWYQIAQSITIVSLNKASNCFPAHFLLLHDDRIMRSLKTSFWKWKVSSEDFIAIIFNHSVFVLRVIKCEHWPELG